MNREYVWGGKLIVLAILAWILEGALRKWYFESKLMEMFVYGLKDLLLVAAAFIAPASAHSAQLARVVIVVNVVCIIPPSIFWYSDLEFIPAILSLRAYLVVPLAAILASQTIQSKNDIRRIANVAGVCVIAVTALCLLQFNLPTNHVLNRYAGDAEYVTGFSGRVRTSGTFAFLSGINSLVFLGTWAGALLFLTSSRVGYQRLFAVSVFAGCLVCSLTSMSRTALGLLVLMSLGAGFAFHRGRDVIYGLVVLSVGGLVAGLYGYTPSQSDVYQVAMSRYVTTTDSLAHRTFFMQFRDIQRAIEIAPMGRGLGAGQPVAGLAYDRRVDVETELGRIVIELGILGLLGVFALRLVIITMMIGWLRRSKDSFSRAVFAATLPAVAVCLFGTGNINLIFDHYLMLVYWVVVSVALAAASLPAERNNVESKLFKKYAV